MARPPSDKPLARLDFPMSEDVAQHLVELQSSVRATGHARPTPKTLVSALILAEKRRGEDLEAELLVPFRLTHPEAD
jgi:hypothetical protein